MPKAKLAAPLPGAETVGRLHIEYEPLSTLLGRRDGENAKAHDQALIEESFREHGFVTPILMDDASNVLGAGHGRLEALEARRSSGKEPPDRIEVRDGEWFVPVVRGVKFKDEKARRKYALLDNRAVEIGGWNDAILAPLLQSFDGDFIGSGFDGDYLAKMLASIDDESKRQAGKTDPNAVPELPTKATTKLGELWILGDHRLLCGDSTKVEDVSRLMGDERAILMATDPPYGVDYTDEQRVLAERAHGRPARKQKWDVSIDNDDKTGENIQPFLEACFRAALGNALAKKAAWYLWHAQMTQGFFAAAAAAAANLVLHRQIIWVKPSLLFGFGDYHWRHELAFYGWVKGQRPKFYGKRNQTTVWEVGNETSAAKRVHPTQKPVALFEIPMNNHTVKGQVCYEPFSGSGTQIIAGERMERRVFAMEIDPKYVDVAVKRWEDYTGKKAVLERV